MKKKEIVDSELASFIHKKLKNTPKSASIDKTLIPFIHILHAWDLSPDLGKKLFQGWLVLHQQEASQKMIESYCHLVLGSTDTSLSVREALASFLPAILLTQDDTFEKRCLEVFCLLQSCGLMIRDIEPSIQLLVELLEVGDFFTAKSWTNLLHTYYSLDLGYQTYLASASSLPRTVRKILPLRRLDHISFLEQVLATSPALVHPALKWKTFDFDLELLCDRLAEYPLPGKVLQNFLKRHQKSLPARQSTGDMANDFSRFFSCFDDPELARDLFTICEHTRQRHLIKTYYPGMWRRTENLLADEIKRQADVAHGCPFPLLLYSFMAVNKRLVEELEKSDTRKNVVYAIASSYTTPFCTWDKVEDSGALLIDLYSRVATIAYPKETWEVPFGRKFNEDPYYSNSLQREQTAAALKSHLEKKGRRVYKAQIRASLERLEYSTTAEVASYLQDLDLDTDAGSQASTLISRLQYLIRENGVASQNPSDRQRESAFSYPEWDVIQKRYKPDFVTVTVQRPRSFSSDFYSRILREYDVQVGCIRNTFERMKPEKIRFERRAIDGDEFDYDALIDHRIDRKIRRTPSQNIYLKKKKDERDIATLLLVDLSRSTNNLISDAWNRTVLDLEKEAIVLFCEALNTVGDAFEVAGFSGFDRHGVEYYPIKEFNEVMGDEIQGRIASITSVRGTRTGAAIRHAISRLEQVAAKVKILLLLGDGFPNDEGYRREYAFADTQKAIWEAESKKIKTRFITVNISHISRLDELYGQFRNNVISDIQELPDKLVGIYRNLTR